MSDHFDHSKAELIRYAEEAWDYLLDREGIDLDPQLDRCEDYEDGEPGADAILNGLLRRGLDEEDLGVIGALVLIRRGWGLTLEDTREGSRSWNWLGEGQIN